MAVIRLNSGPEFGFDKDGARTARETFRVTGTPYSAAAFLALSDFGLVHPDLNLPFRRVTSNQRDQAGSVVTLEYGNSNGGYVDPNDVDFRSFSVTSQRVTTDHPRYIKVRTEYDDGSGNTQNLFAWRQAPGSPIAVTRAHPMLTFRTNDVFIFSDVSASAAAAEAIIEMTGNLHNLNGKLYSFEPRIIDQEKPDRWIVEYQWVRDRGIELVYPGASGFTPVNGWYDLPSQDLPQSPLPENWRSVIPLAVDTAGDYGPAGKRWIRLPYHNISVYPNPIDPPDPSQLPICVQSLQHDNSAPLAWQTLPGIA